MSFVSYAQNFEDVILWRALHDVEAGHYIDIGAQEPEIDSVSAAFYKAGWRGIHVEPIPTYAARLREARPDEVVIQAAVSDARGPIEFFELGGLSSGRQDIADHHRKSGHQPQPLMVPTVRLDDVFEVSRGDVHWLKIDVEGMESDVLRSWGDSPKRPWILVIESTYPETEESTRHLWIDEVSARGYTEAFFDGLSRYFVHETHAGRRDRLNRPANVFDHYQITSQHFSAELIRSKAEAQQAESAAVIQALKLDVVQEREHFKAAELERTREHSARLQLEGRVAELDEQSTLEREARARSSAELLKIARMVGNDPDEFEGSPDDEEAVPPGTTYAAVKSRLAVAREELDRSRELAVQQYISGQKSRDSEVSFLNERSSTLQQEISEFPNKISTLQNEISTLQNHLGNARESLSLGQREREKLQSLIDDQSEALAAIRSDAEKLGRELSQAREIASSIYGTRGGRLAQRIGLIPSRPVSSESPQEAVSAAQRQPDQASGIAQQGEMEISVSEIRHTSNLLALNGAVFVDALYRTFLKRAADRAGRDHYISRLQAGASKERILLGIAGSPEARAVGVEMDGLAELRRADTRQRRWSFFNSGGRAIDVRLNKLQYSLGEAQNSLANRLDRMESSLEQIQSKLESSPSLRPHASGREAGVFIQGVPVSLKRGVSIRATDGAAEFISELRDSVQGSMEALSLRNGR